MTFQRKKSDPSIYLFTPAAISNRYNNCRNVFALTLLSKEPNFHSPFPTWSVHIARLKLSSWLHDNTNFHASPAIICIFIL